MFNSSKDNVGMWCVLTAGWLSLDQVGVGPVEFLAGDGQRAAHAFKDVTHVIVHGINSLLVGSLSFADSSDDVLAVSSCQRDVSEVFLQGELNVTLFVVVVVDLDGARDGVGLHVDEPGRLPLARPEVFEVSVDAADIYLQLSILVEAEGSTCCAVLVVLLDIVVDGDFHLRPNVDKNGARNTVSASCHKKASVSSSQ